MILNTIHVHELFADVSEDDETYDKHLDSWDIGKAGSKLKDIFIQLIHSINNLNFLPFHQYESNYEL